MTTLSSLLPAAAASTATSAAASTTSAANATDLAAGAANLNTSYSDFLTLLTTQLKNQDPTSPMDTNTFTQQLVAMTGVQQQLLTNQLLEQMTTNEAGGVSSAVDLIGKTVTATTSNASLSNGSAQWSYSLPAAAASGVATITNAAGSVVYTGALSSLSAGANTFAWNGQNPTGVSQPAGVYTLAVTAADASGTAITPTLTQTGTASSVQVVNGVTNVTVGGLQIPVSSLTGVAGS
jgi:flagellar basal-body rod modification protein FlgD